MNFYLDVEGRKIRATIFNRHFLRSKINYGTYVRLTGKFNENMPTLLLRKFILMNLARR